MFLNSTKLMLTNTMVIGVTMTICSNNWYSMWMGLEISLLSFIPLMQTSKALSSESMIKYYIVQSVASTLMLLSVSVMLIGVSMMNLLLTMSMLIKIGASPFHNWLMMIIETMNFYEIWILLTLMKMPPLSILFQINIKLVTVSVILGMILGSIMCLNQTSIRKTLGYSSIFNISLVLSIISNFNFMIIFMLIYSFMLLMFIFILMKFKINFINQMVFNEVNLMMKINLWINMLSMGGFPPLMGFLMKLIVIQFMIFNNEYFLLTIMMFTSIVVMLFYMRLMFTSLMFLSTSMKFVKFNLNSSFNLIINLIVFPMIVSLTLVY
uniref:NADH-ubiquinone oxidoreductase chain 2 n=1 Tax=Balclutha sp. EMHAU-2015-Zz052711 TaxID=2036851 RepID=A0A343K1A0_9HEMI|nr:NADH dehydrogenase subunit 2 [Balclutha sp. EMHAU-2015-Zz052711]